MKDLAKMEREFKELERRIRRLKQLEKELNSLNTEGFESEAKAIISKLKDPRKIEEVERDVAALKIKAKEREEKLKEEEHIKKGVLNAVSGAEKSFNIIKDKGVIITSGEELLIKSKQALDNGDYRSAGKLSGELKKLVNDRGENWKEAKDRLKSAESAIEMAREFGCNISEAEELLNKAIAEFERGNYKEAISDASRSEEMAKEIKEEAKPEIVVDLSKKEFRAGVWEKVLVKVLNSGNANAKNIEIEFKRAEVEGLEIIKNLGVGEKRDLKLDFMPEDAGSVPLKIDVRLEDFDGKSYEETGTVHINVGEIKVKEKYGIPLEKKIEIKRSYEIRRNNDLRFGIRVINNTDYLIADVETILDYPKTLFIMKDQVVQTLANIHPNGERTAEYILTPLGCIHNEKIEATIFYKDHTGKKQTVQMRPKEVHCVCPFLKGKAMREGEFAELANTCKRIEEGLSFSGIGVTELTVVIKESCTHLLYVIGEHEIETAKIVYLAGESIGEKAYYLLTAVIQPYKNLTQIALRAYSDKPYGLHGFLNEIADRIRYLVGSVQSAKEIGVIESKQVINIIDSVVQRTSFGGVVEGETTVNIEASVVQRTEVCSIKKCPNCGKEVRGNEKFCKECGSRLE